jgi:hypothetical protein
MGDVRKISYKGLNILITDVIASEHFNAGVPVEYGPFRNAVSYVNHQVQNELQIKSNFPEYFDGP